MAKKAVPNRQKKPIKRENKFIDMSKEEIIRLCVIVGVVIIAIVLFFVLRSAFDGHLAVKDGVVVTEGDNWIVANTGTTASPRYFKLGEVGEVEGYTRSLNEEEYVTDTNLKTYYYNPTDEASPLKYGYIGTGSGEYDTLIKSVQPNYASYITGATVGDIVETEIGGKPVAYFTFQYNYAPTNEDGTQGETVYYGGLNAYTKAGRGQSIVVHLNAEEATAEALPSDEALVALLPPFIEALKVEP